MITKNVKLYLGDGFPVRIPVSQYDTMWQFVFTIIHNSQPWQIPTGATAVLNGRKPDGNVFAFAGTIENNTVTVNADVQMTAVAGQTVCELSILSDGKVVGTANFVLDVEAAPKSPDDVSSETTLPAYQEMLDAMANIPYDIHGSVEDWLNAHPEATTTVQDGSITEQKLDPYLTAKVNGGGISNAVKVALLALLEKVAYVDEDGQTYLDALEDALYPPAGLVSITAVFNQGENTIYDTDTLDDLKQYLTVTAHMDDGTTQTVTTYTLSGLLEVGTSTITVVYGGQTTTFSVNVTEKPKAWYTGVPLNYGTVESGNISTTTGEDTTDDTKLRTGLLDIEGACTIMARRIDNKGGQQPRFFFYDTDGDFISSYVFNSTNNKIPIAPIPTDTKYVRVTAPTDNIGESATTPWEFVPFATPTVNFAQGETLITSDTVGYSIITATGKQGTSGSQRSSQLIPIYGATTITIGASGSYSNLAFYDKDENYMSCVPSVHSPITSEKIPYNKCAYMRVYNIYTSNLPITVTME